MRSMMRSMSRDEWLDTAALVLLIVLVTIAMTVTDALVPRWVTWLMLPLGLPFGYYGMVLLRGRSARRRRTDREKVAKVEGLVDQAKKISPSAAMSVYVGDLEKALGRVNEGTRGKRGGNDE